MPCTRLYSICTRRLLETPSPKPPRKWPSETEGAGKPGSCRAFVRLAALL